MKITKLNHACLLIKNEDKVFLIDPGSFSTDLVNEVLPSLEKLDYVLITHDHFDHFDPELCRAISDKYPKAKFIGTSDVVNKLKDLGLDNASTKANELIDIYDIGHDSMSPLAPENSTQNFAIKIMGRLITPGDSHHLTESSEILCLPMDGPWGSTIEAVRMVDRLKPRYVLPIHDWMWNEDWRNMFYERIYQYLLKQNITFIKLENSKEVEI